METVAAAHLLATEYGIEATRIETLSAADTVVHRVHVGADRYALRVHGDHTEDEIAANMTWLHALRRTDVQAPVPVRTLRGAWVTNHATLVRWVEGRHRRKTPRPVHYERLGRLMAQLHDHVLTWQPPSGFTRPRWSAAEVLCERGIGAPPSGDAWKLVPRRFVAVLREACDAAWPALDEPESVLIHADLHLSNVVFAGGCACPIDFDDSGYGALGYDFASALSSERMGPSWPWVWDAFAAGYEGIRPLPDLARLDEFMMGRIAGLALWAASMAQTLPHWEANLPRWIGNYAGQLRRLLDGAA